MNQVSLKEAVVIVPTYNEIDNIDNMLRTLTENYPDLSILIVDDNSPDGTADVVEKFQKQFPEKIHLMRRKGKLGLGTAYITGFRWAIEKNFQYVLEMDCDFSHDPKDIPRLVEAAQSNDLVIGSRYIDGIRIINWPIHRLLLSYFAGVYTRIITGITITDPTGGFKCFTQKALKSINLDKIISNGYSFQIELNFKVVSQGLNVKEVPIIFTERRNGHSKMSGGIVKEAVFAVIFLRLRKIFGIL